MKLVVVVVVAAVVVVVEGHKTQVHTVSHCNHYKDPPCQYQTSTFSLKYQ
jgi:hypothetical protein